MPTPPPASNHHPPNSGSAFPVQPIFDAVTDPVVGINAGQRITYWNAAAEAVYGRPAADVIGQPIDAILPTDYLDSDPRTAADTLHTAGIWRGRIRQPNHNGEPREFFAVSVAHYDAQNQLDGVLTIYHALTDHAPPSAALHRSAARFAAIVDLAADAIITVNQHQRITSFNQSAETIFGYTAAEVLNQPLETLIPHGHKTHHSQLVDRFVLNHDANDKVNMAAQFQREVQGLRKDGSVFPAEATVSRMRFDDETSFTVIIRDISERVAAQQTLREREAQLRLLTSHASDLVCLHDLALNCLYASPAATDLLGHTPEQLRERPFHTLIHADDQPRVQAEAFTPALLGERPAPITYRLIRRDQTEIWVESYVRPVLDDNGQVTQIITTTRDVTARVLAEREIRQLNADLEDRVARRTADLEAANRSLQAFSYSVAHDLRAPLRAMHGFAQILEEDYGNQFDELGQDFLHRITQSAKRMDAMIEDLLAYSRISYMDIESTPVNLEAVVYECLAQLWPQIEATHAQISVDTPLLAIQGHRLLLVQALSNLLGNAIKFVAPNVQPEIRVSARAIANDSVALDISDNGIGIDPKDHARVFQIFERLHNYDVYPGTGIGLATVQKSIEIMGGQIELHSTPGKGSTFSIILPRAAAPTA